MWLVIVAVPAFTRNVPISNLEHVLCFRPFCIGVWTVNVRPLLCTRPSATRVIHSYAYTRTVHPHGCLEKRRALTRGVLQNSLH